ncbi:hypothetical protein AGIG_G19653 [Arapaima gigas]
MIRSVGDQDRTAAAGLRLSSSPSHSGRQSPRSRLSRGKQAGPPQGDRAPLSPRSRNHPQGGDGDRTSADTDEAPRLSGTLHDRRDLSTTAHSTAERQQKTTRCPVARTRGERASARGDLRHALDFSGDQKKTHAKKHLQQQQQQQQQQQKRQRQL